MLLPMQMAGMTLSVLAVRLFVEWWHACMSLDKREGKRNNEQVVQQLNVSVPLKIFILRDLHVICVLAYTRLLHRQIYAYIHTYTRRLHRQTYTYTYVPMHILKSRMSMDACGLCDVYFFLSSV